MGSVWRDARTIADLGAGMAQWLEGRIPSWPGYEAGCGPDEETRHLVPDLAALNRAGFVTTNSQPGTDGIGYDEARWRQRAYVEGVIDDRNPLLHRVIRAAGRAGMTVVRGRGYLPTPLVLTERDGQPMAAISVRAPRDQVAREWHGIGRQALKALRQHGAHISIVDPVWGRDTHLWPALRGA